MPLHSPTTRQDDAANLSAILEGTPWALNEAAIRAEAVRIVRETSVPIVLCDRDVGAGPWQETMAALIAARRGACVILLSIVADQYLWDEVIRLGGFDVLTRPFQKEQVLAMLMFAYTHWKTSWPKSSVV